MQPSVRYELLSTTGRAVPTLSGVRIAALPPARAQMFLASLDVNAPRRVDVALGGFQDDYQLIGVGVLAVVGRLATTFVAVDPARRRLGVGTDLLHALLDEAAAREVDRVRGRCGSSPAARAFVVAVTRSAAERPSREGRRTAAPLPSPSSPRCDARHGNTNGALRQG